MDHRRKRWSIALQAYLHWSDPASVRLLDVALRSLSNRALMVLTFARPEVRELFPNLCAQTATVLPRRARARDEGTRQRAEPARQRARRDAGASRWSRRRHEEGCGRVHAAHLECLLACNKLEDARLVSKEANAFLDEQAAMISDPVLRAGYLENLSENAIIRGCARRFASRVDVRGHS